MAQIMKPLLSPWITTVFGTSALCCALSAAAFSENAGAKPGSTYRDCPTCPEMVVVPSGQFLMGSPTSEKGRDNNEGPQHRVTIAKPFAVGKFEVTFAEWDACVMDDGCKDYRPGDEGWGRGRRPVINVSWYDAKSYVMWLNRKTGKAYRLLSEAEWEYAARAVTTTPFSTGQTITSDQANFNGWITYNGSPDLEGQYRGKTISVGSFAPNAFGLNDMHGNVWEWVEDCYNKSYSEVSSDSSAHVTGDCSQRVQRGGSWDLDPGFLRSASRYWINSVFRIDYIGFRVAGTLAP